MVRIVVGGQIGKKDIVALIEKHGSGKVEVKEMGDIEAALAVKNNAADYYFGACNTGGGGALAMATAILGMDVCATLSIPGKIKTDEEIEREVKLNKKAFGFTFQHAEQIVPVILRFLS
ncbi:Protein of unknown function DUF2620 [Alkalispirochaeta americana]|uniref:DUF2620 domain-containing protein n=1 Tax=Alkalispirochaeta americana TaxID=159291 RepID=A0A1N6XR26_9SPIO|nr:DUF2620 domain-containing protein [Alkalispirochaeta americana]SIR04780.1 Protein of unknown function DUF2620 [Alkalispirochaeta americana]